MNRRSKDAFFAFLKFMVHSSRFIVIRWPNEEGIVFITMNDKKKRRYGLQMGLNALIKVEEVWRENQPKSY